MQLEYMSQTNPLMTIILMNLFIYFSPSTRSILIPLHRTPATSLSALIHCCEIVAALSISAPQMACKLCQNASCQQPRELRDHMVTRDMSLYQFCIRVPPLFDCPIHHRRILVRVRLGRKQLLCLREEDVHFGRFPERLDGCRAHSINHITERFPLKKKLIHMYNSSSLRTAIS